MAILIAAVVIQQMVDAFDPEDIPPFCAKPEGWLEIQAAKRNLALLGSNQPL